MLKNVISKKGEILEFAIAAFLIFIGAICRLLPHPPNFTPIAAIALFGGVYFSKKISLILPILVMTISDLFLGFYSWHLMVFVYLSFLICVFLGFKLKNHKKWPTVLGYSLLGSIIFYLLTNFAVWAFTGWYQKGFSGLIQCYFMALPFFKNTLLGGLFYTTLFFGVYEITKVWIRKKFRVSETIPISIKK